MKNFILSLSVIIAITGCQSVNMDSLTSSALNQTFNSLNNTNTHSDHQNTPSNNNVQYSTKKEPFYISKAKRSSSNLGHVEILKCVANPSGTTKVVLQSATQTDSGGRVKAKAYLYPVSSKGWLVDEAVTFHNIGRERILNSGTYYVKAQDSSGRLHASGEITVLSGQTNILVLSVN